MPRTEIFHALALHMHQPPGNLRNLIEHNDWEAQQIIHCYDRATRYAHKYADTAQLHIAFSGILLEQLRDPEIVERYLPHMDIPAMLNSYREARNIELIGTGYYHPVFPLIPEEDWDEQLRKSNQLMQGVFGRKPKGFCPPAMFFSMEMIPALVKNGYQYVLIDSGLIRPLDGSAVDPYQVYRASYEGSSVSIVPRDVDLSHAQQYGLEAAWFANEVMYRANSSAQTDTPRLFSTWSDGENSEWFRRMDEENGYFGHFFSPYMEHTKSGEYPVRPVSLSKYLKTHPAAAEAAVETVQWHGSTAQIAALEAIKAAGGRFRSFERNRLSSLKRGRLSEARRLIMESETSCFLYWDDTWLGKVQERIDGAHLLLDEVEAKPAAKKAAPKKSAAKSGGSGKRSPAKKTTAAGAETNSKPAEAKKTATKSSAAKPSSAAKTSRAETPAKSAAVSAGDGKAAESTVKRTRKSAAKTGPAKSK